MLTIPTGELVGTIADVLPFASTDKELPGINAVKVHWDGQRMHAFATDRYVAAWARWHPGDDPTPDHKEGAQDDLFSEWGGVDDSWEFVLPLVDAAEIVKIFKLPVKLDRHPLELDVDYPRVTIRRRPTGAFSAITAQFDAILGSAFPDLRPLIAGVGEDAWGIGKVAWDPKRLATFAKVRRHGVAHFHINGGTKPTRIEIGERFSGLIMPIREFDEDVPPPEPVEQVDGQEQLGEEG